MSNPAPLAEPHPTRPAAPAPAQALLLQPLDYTSLRAVLSELDPLIVPSRFEKAQQSEAHTLQLGLRTLSGSQWLELSWLAEAPRLLAIPPPPRLGDGSTLAQQLQHGLRGLALVELHQPAWERVVELRFAPRPGEPIERSLVLELMGRHSNLFLLDAERRVIALARQVRDRQSRLRPIGTGDPYQSPPSQAGEPPRPQESFASWRQRLSLLPLPLGKALLAAYQGVSPALVRQLLEAPGAVLPMADAGHPQRDDAEHAATGRLSASLPVLELSEAQWQGLWSRWQAWLGALEQGRFLLAWDAAGGYRCWSEPLGGASPSCGGDAAGAALPGAVGGEPDSGPAVGSGEAGPGATAVVCRDGPAEVARPERPEALAINRALAAHYGGLLGARRSQQRRAALEARLRAALERERSQLVHQQALLAAVPEADGLQRQADGLLCLPDPDRQTIDEAQALYRRARKLRRSVAAISPRIALHEQRLAGLETSLTFLEQLEGLDPREGETALEALEEELLEQLERLRPAAAAERQPGRNRARRREAKRAEPRPLELRSAAGLRLQVGRNHRQNEWISLRQARRGDLWFHAQELPGSHVVLKGSEAPPCEADLQAAADLAAHFSRGRGNRRVPVLMVPTESLQRIPGAEPGTVRHRGGEVLWGEPERALALLRRAEPRPADLQRGEPTGPSPAGAP